MGPVRDEFRQIWAWEERHRRLIGRLGLVVVATLVIDLAGTVLIFMSERHARFTDVHSFGDALFFTTVQLLTVSSQMRNPLTPFGRIVDVLLEAWAVLVVAGSAGAIAAFFQQSD